MPRGGRRDGAGRPGWKAKAERSTSLDVRHLDRAGVFRGPCGGSGTNGSASISFTAVEGWLTLSYAIGGEARTQQIAITRTPCHYGGTRPWFRCPGGERVAVLYLRAGRFACRQEGEGRYFLPTQLWHRRLHCAPRDDCDPAERSRLG